MLKHCVFVQFKNDISLKERERVLRGFGELLVTVEGMLDYSFGPNLDFENKSKAFDHGFIVTFVDREAHLEYERHPLHIALGTELVNMCQGGHDGIIVFDLKA